MIPGVIKFNNTQKIASILQEYFPATSSIHLCFFHHGMCPC
jgi:hypothetical protein